MCEFRQMIEDLESATEKIIENNSDTRILEELVAIKGDATFAVYEAYNVHRIRLDEKKEFLQRISDLNIKLFEYVSGRLEHLLREK